MREPDQRPCERSERGLWSGLGFCLRRVDFFNLDSSSGGKDDSNLDKVVIDIGDMNRTGQTFVSLNRCKHQNRPNDSVVKGNQIIQVRFFDLNQDD